MKAQVIGAVALLLLAGCGQQAAEQPSAETPTELHSGISIANMDNSVRPGDDFFSYVNGTWVAETEIPADKGRYGAFDLLRDESQANVKTIIEESASGDFAKGSDEQKVGDLYKSFMDTDTRDAKGIAPLQPELQRIDAIADHDDLAAYFADAMKRNLDAPIGFGQTEDFKDPTRYIIYVMQGGLGLPDREYYLKADEKSEALRGQYVEHIAAMFDLAGFDDARAAASTIMVLETRLATENMSKEQSRKWVENYTKVMVEDLPELMPNFNWERYLAAGGLQSLDSLVFFNTDYVKALDGIIADTDIDTWKTYLYWGALNKSASRLTAALDKQNFEFYGKALSGTEEQRAMWRRGVNSVNGILGEVVGKVYVKRHFPPEAKERMLNLVGNLVNAYAKSINELDWMSDETKVEALDKLSKFTPKIGYPDEWRDYSALDIEADDYYGNVERAAMAEFQRLMDRHDGPVDRSEWGITPQTVNAYYNPPLNEIVFPAAILQPPFFDLNAEDAVNYGGIGAVIGHEIGHGFDDQGRKYDGGGNLRDWWTEEDNTLFEERKQKLAAQYSSYEVVDGMTINGEFTSGENIGDLGGLSIAYKAYKLSLDGKEAPVIDGLTGDQRFFLGYAQVWRSKARDEEVKRRLTIDPHSPAKFRANGAAINVTEFYDAFDVQEGDGMWLPPEDRVKIW